MFLFLGRGKEEAGIPLQNKVNENDTLLKQLGGWRDVAVEVLCLGLEGTLPHQTRSVNIDGPALEFERVQPIRPSIHTCNGGCCRANRTFMPTEMDTTETRAMGVVSELFGVGM